jgi:plasmid stability protein
MTDISLEISDELYDAIRVVAARKGRSVEEEALAFLIASFRDGAPSEAARILPD